MSASYDFSFLADSLMSRMGMQIQQVRAEETIIQMPVAPNVQPGGVLHGGASAALAETAASLAAWAHGKDLSAVDGKDRFPVGTDLSISHISPGVGQFVRAVAVAVQLGGRRCVHSVKIFSEGGALVSQALVGNQLQVVKN